MELWHRTDQVGRDGIAREGFRVPRDSPPASTEHGLIWFAATKEEARFRVPYKSGWWVKVEAPDETPEYDMSDPDLAGHGIYAIHVDAANALPRSIEAGQ